MNNFKKEEKDRSLRSHPLEGLDTPFLMNELFTSESSVGISGPFTKYASESPFQQAFEHGPTSFSGSEGEFVKEEQLLQTLSFPQGCLTKPKNISVAVVGGGLAGLMAARRLSQYGIKVTVFEARDQWGGRVLSNRKFSKDRITEEGAELIGTFHTKWLTLAQEYGLACISRMDEDLYGRQCLKAVNLTLGKLLSMEEINKLDKEMEEQVLFPIAKLASRIKYPDQPWLDHNLRDYDNMTVADALTKLYGVKRDGLLWKALEFLLVNNEVGPLEEMNFLGLLCKVKAGQGKRCNGDQEVNEPNLMGYWNELETFRCADGCQELAKRIANEIEAKYKAKLKLSMAVTKIDIFTKTKKVALEVKKVINRNGKLSDGPAVKVGYDYVILAIPPTVWSGVKIKADSKDLNLEHEVGLIGMGGAVKFFSDLKERFWIKEKSAPSGGSLTLGMVWEGTENQTRIGDQGIVLSVFAGPIIVDNGKRRPPNEKEFKVELKKLFPGYTSNLKKNLLKDWPHEPFIMTGYAAPKIGEIFKISRKWIEPLKGHLFFAGEHTQMDFFGYMEGALRSGERAAEILVKQACGLQEPYQVAESLFAGSHDENKWNEREEPGELEDENNWELVEEDLEEEQRLTSQTD